MRTKIILSVLAVLVALIAWVLMTPPAAPGRVGVNRLVENEVTTAPAGRTDWQPSVAGADVNFGDRVATAAASRLEVSLLDRSLLTVGSNARVEIDRFVYDPERGVTGVAVSMLRGAFRFASDTRGAQPEPIAFRTPGSAIGIRGTIIEGVVGPQAVAFLSGIPGAPDLSSEADSAAVIILREGVIGVEVNGQSVVLDRPVQMVALTRTRLYPPFGATAETDRRFEQLLPTRPRLPVQPASTPPPPNASGEVPTPAPPAPDPASEPTAREPPGREPPARDPPARPAPVQDLPTRQPEVAKEPATDADPPVRPPLTRSPATRDAPAPLTAAPRPAAPLTAAPRPAPPTRQPVPTRQ